MTYNQVVAHYRGLSKAAQALGLSRQTVHSWRRLGRIPSMRQIKISALTGLPPDRKARAEVIDLASYVQRNGNGS